MRRRPELRVILSFLSVGLLLSACAGGGLFGVGVKQRASELVFGIPPLPQPVTPPNTVPFDVQDIKALPDDRGGSTTSLSAAPPPPACAEAPLGTAPEDVAPDSIASPPKTGSYRYPYTVTFPKQSSIAYTGLETRTIRGVVITDQAGPNFDFEVVQKLAQTNTEVEVISRFRVDQTSPRARTGPSAAPGASGKGVFLTRLDRTVKASGKTQERSTFTPNPPLKYMDLPARIGFEGAFDSTSVDSSSFTTMRHRGEVVRREPVDACGTVIDSWYVQATQTITAPNGQTFTSEVNYGIGTQFGGLMILENYKSPATNPDIIFHARLGQTQPS